MSLSRLARKHALIVPKSYTVFDAIEVMVKEGVGAVTVGDGLKPEGIFTERDVLKKIVHAGTDPKTTQLVDLMTENITVVPDETDVNEALAIMTKKRFRHLPVVNNAGEIIGMISLRFLHHDRMEDMLHDMESLEAYYAADGPGG